MKSHFMVKPIYFIENIHKNIHKCTSMKDNLYQYKYEL